MYWQTSNTKDPSDLASVYLRSEVDQFYNIAGATVRVRDEGPKNAPVILLLHGFLYSLETWDDWAEKLTKDHRVIRYDLLGHGLSGPDPQKRYAPKERAAFIGDLMDALEIEQAILGGNSLGGLAAWRFATTNPEKVSSLILVAPGGYSMNGVTDKAVPPPDLMKFFLTTAPAAGVRATLGEIYEDNNAITSERVDLMRDMMLREGNGQAFIQSIEEFTLPNPQEDLQNLQTPTLILWGSEDKIIPSDHAARFHQALPNSQLIVYPNVGHVPHEEAPAETLADVLQFLENAKTNDK